MITFIVLVGKSMENTNIKEFCVSCKHKINDQTEQRYLEEGNYCGHCNAECERNGKNHDKTYRYTFNGGINLSTIGYHSDHYLETNKFDRFIEELKLKSELFNLENNNCLYQQ